MDDFKG